MTSATPSLSISTTRTPSKTPSNLAGYKYNVEVYETDGAGECLGIVNTTTILNNVSLTTNRYYCYPGDDRVYRILSTSTTWVLQTNISSGLARTTCGVAAADCI